MKNSKIKSDFLIFKDYLRTETKVRDDTVGDGVEGGWMQIQKYYLSSTPEGTSNASLGVSQEETCFTYTMCVMNAHQS